MHGKILLDCEQEFRELDALVSRGWIVRAKIKLIDAH